MKKTLLVVIVLMVALSCFGGEVVRNFKNFENFMLLKDSSYDSLFGVIDLPYILEHVVEDLNLKSDSEVEIVRNIFLKNIEKLMIETAEAYILYNKEYARDIYYNNTTIGNLRGAALILCTKTRQGEIDDLKDKILKIIKIKK
ncbi:hypothetical protein K8R66_00540 [bacterium]|nr:hypothetical protein [bacterium]